MDITIFVIWARSPAQSAIASSTVSCLISIKSKAFDRIKKCLIQNKMSLTQTNSDATAIKRAFSAKASSNGWDVSSGQR